ncbi:type II TA system antitoxin MqsA family protein [Desulfofundulus thermobenzoicus]|nr:type II TA system antitoxin MqsA family protein [Desulfofundulus thermobenzoicus]
MIKYCDQCGGETVFSVAEREENYDIRGERIRVVTKVWRCQGCGLELFDDELTGPALKEAYNEYRRRKNIPAPEDIKELRGKFGLSLRSFAKLLGWGYVTLHRYENGALPSEAHAAVLAALKANPSYAFGLLETTKRNFEKDEMDGLLKRIDALTRECNHPSKIRHEEKCEANVFTGFVPFSVEKFRDMVLWFSSMEAPLLKTKLLKLLWYADFLHFKRHGVGISGAVYVHLPLGPVPDNFTFLLGELEWEHKIKIEPVPVGDYLAERIIPVAERGSSLSEDELRTLKDVLKQFQGWGSRRISSYSHEEKAYLSTGQGEEISYEYAVDLSID